MAQKTILPHNKDQLVNAEQGNNSQFFRELFKHTNTLCTQNAVLQIIKAGCTFSYNWAVNY